LRELQRRAPPSTEGCWLSKVTVRGRGVLDDLETTDCGAPARQGSKDLTPLLETSLMLGRREQADGACVQDDDGRVRAQLWVVEHSQLEMGAEQAAAAQHRRHRLRSLEGLAVESAREALACSPRPIPVLASQTRGERAGDDWEPLVGGPAAEWQDCGRAGDQQHEDRGGHGL
jgi:hypothetical protein